VCENPVAFGVIPSAARACPERSRRESWSRSTRPRPPPKAGKLRGVYPERSRRAQGDRESKLLTHALRTHARSDETGCTRRGLDFVAAGRHPTGMLRHSLLEFVSPRCGVTSILFTHGVLGISGGPLIPQSARAHSLARPEPRSGNAPLAHSWCAWRQGYYSGGRLESCLAGPRGCLV